MEELKSIIEKAWDDRSLLGSEEARNAVFQIIELLDKGKVRVAEPAGNAWKVNESVSYTHLDVYKRHAKPCLQ